MIRFVLASAIAIAICLAPASVRSDDFRRYPRSYGSDRVHVYVHDGDRGSIHHTGPASTPSEGPGPCFPYGCGGISGPFKNPDPDARKPQNLTACIYDVQGTLLYEREGKVCPYKYVDQNTMRVERRRQEYLKAHSR